MTQTGRNHVDKNPVTNGAKQHDKEQEDMLGRYALDMVVRLQQPNDRVICQDILQSKIPETLKGSNKWQKSFMRNIRVIVKLWGHSSKQKYQIKQNEHIHFTVDTWKQPTAGSNLDGAAGGHPHQATCP